MQNGAKREKAEISLRGEGKLTEGEELCRLVLSGVPSEVAKEKMGRTKRFFEKMSEDAVCKHFLELGASEECCKYIRREEVDGAKLFRMPHEDLHDVCRISNDVIGKHIEWMERKKKELMEQDN